MIRFTHTQHTFTLQNRLIILLVCIAQLIFSGVVAAHSGQQSSPRYWLFIHSNDCSYSASIDDMPVFTDFNEGNISSLSFPINPLLLQGGAHTLKITLLPKQNRNFNLDTALSKGYFVKIKIVRNENKKDSTVLEQEFRANPDEARSTIVHTLPFQVDLPYKLAGWQHGADLGKENQETLQQEVVNYYTDMIRDYEKKDFNRIVEKYHMRIAEHAQSLYFDQADSNKLMEELKKDVERKQTFKLAHYDMQLYANGKVVALIRTDPEFKGKSAFLGLTDDNYHAYKLLLYRPSAGAPLQLIR